MVVVLSTINASLLSIYRRVEKALPFVEMTAEILVVHSAEGQRCVYNVNIPLHKRPTRYARVQWTIAKLKVVGQAEFLPKVVLFSYVFYRVI